MIITLTTTIAPVVTMSIPSTPCDSRRRAERKHGRPAPDFGYTGEHFATAQKALNAWRDSAWTRSAV